MRRPHGLHPRRRAAHAPEIDKIVEGLVARKKYIYLCTNALLLKEKIDLFSPANT